MSDNHASPDYEPWPLDIILLSHLPDEGSMLGGIHHLGRRASDLYAALPREAQAVTSVDQVTSRLRSMRVHGLTVHHPGGGSGTKIWQRTPAGRALHEGAEVGVAEEVGA